jgi:hypothetical protein
LVIFSVIAGADFTALAAAGFFAGAFLAAAAAGAFFVAIGLSLRIGFQTGQFHTGLEDLGVSPGSY